MKNDARKERRSARYWMYRIRKEILEKSPLAGEPEGFRAEWETKEGFTGWKDFACTWDLSEDEPLRIVRRKYSEEELWNWTLLAESREIPIRRG